MRILSTKLLAAVGIVTGMLTIAGCASMSESECMASDWRMVGYEDGVVGYSGDRIGRYRKACAEHGVTPDLAEYQLGRDEGLREFCKPLNGFHIGTRGAGYTGVCPAELDQAFLDAYQSGRQLYTLRARVDSTAQQISSMRSELDRIDTDLANVAVQILDTSITKEHRAQLLVDSKQLAERKGEIKARIPQLEHDLIEYRHELDEYRLTLSYVE